MSDLEKSRGGDDILIVEDDELLKRVMTLQLQLAGFSVRSARTGREAIKLIEEQSPSLLILDVGLPDVTGFEVSNELQQDPTTSAIPLIVHTSLDLTTEQQVGMRLGPTVFVTKSTAYSEKLAEIAAQLLRAPAPENLS